MISFSLLFGFFCYYAPVDDRISKFWRLYRQPVPYCQATTYYLSKAAPACQIAYCYEKDLLSTKKKKAEG
jgi:hypothetical protein